MAASRTAVSTLFAAKISKSIAAPPMNVQRAAGLKGGRGSSSRRRNMAHRVGMITSATNSELDSAMIRVKGMNFMNSPTCPGQNRSGAKAARVVSVAAMTGMATSPVAFLAATRRSQPSSTYR